MTAQSSLFDLNEGRRRRNEALERVAGATPDDWRRRALDAVYQVARRKATFAADDIWLTGLEKPREPRALGPVLIRAVRLGYCQALPTYRPTKNATQHAQPIREYRSLVVEG